MNKRKKEVFLWNRRFICCVILALMFFPQGIFGTGLSFTNTSYAASDYEAKYQSFINDSRWKNGTAWDYYHRPELSTWDSIGCCAYCADFEKYVYGTQGWAGTPFYSVTDIRDGDILHVSPEHWFVVLKRNGNSLYTAEGNCDSRVVVSNSRYTISGDVITYRLKSGEKSVSLKVGYHYNTGSVPDSFKYCVDSISGGVNTVSLRGWAFNENNITKSIQIHAYIDGGPGSVASNVIEANVARTDVDDYYHCGAYHGFNYTISGISDGTHTIQLYANDQYRNTATRIGDYTVTVTTIKGSEMTSGYKRTIPDGNYIIANAGSTDKTSLYFLDILGVEYPASSTSNVTAYNARSLGQQNLGIQDTWTVKYSDGFYTITQSGTNMALDVDGASVKQGANVFVYPSNGSSAQKWAISSNGRNGYRLQAKCSGMSLDVYGGGDTDGANVNQWSNNNTDAQSWLFIPYQPEQPIEEGQYIIQSAKNTNYELDVVGETGDVEENANIQIYKDRTVSRYDSFSLTPLENGYYEIKHAASGKCLEVYGGKSDLVSNISIHEDNDSIAQQWAITKSGDDYVLWARCSGMVMAFEGDKMEQGSNVFQFEYLNSNDQKWSFVPAYHEVKYDKNGAGAYLLPGHYKKPTWTVSKYYKEDLEIKSYGATREGYQFMGWSTDPNATSPSYQQGDVYQKEEDLTLYAVWKEEQASEEALSLVAENVTHTLKVGDTVSVKIKADQNPGYVLGSTVITWAKDALELTGVDYSTMSPNNGSPEIKNSGEYKISFGDPLAKEDFGEIGDFFTLRFKINKSTKEGTYKIGIKEDSGVIYNTNGEKISFKSSDGSITLKDSTMKGDLNDDGIVDLADALILNRYLAGWDGYEDKIKNWDAALISSDDIVDLADALILNRYLAGWNGYEKWFQ